MSNNHHAQRRARRPQRTTRLRFALLAAMLSALCLSLASPRAALRTAHARAAQASNGRVAFTSDRDGNLEIYSMNADGSDQRNLTHNAATDAQPVWSPDGTRIAFTSDRGGFLNIYVMNADGSNVRRITQNGAGNADLRVYDPAWTADGAKIVYVSNLMGEIAKLVAVNADGAGSPTLFGGDSQAADPALSPDGTRVAYVDREPVFNPEDTPAFSVLVAQSDGSGANFSKRTRVGPFPTVNFSSFERPPNTTGPAWSPDGTRIAYSYTNPAPAVGLPRSADIAVVSASGAGSPVFLTTTPAKETQPAWSPDGSKIIYTSDAPGTRQLFVMNSDGASQTQITSGPGNNFDADWQPLGFTPPPAAAATVQLRSEAFRIRESGAGGDSITVTRHGDLSRAATVDFSTHDVDCSIDVAPGPRCRAASDRSDYVALSGTLRFEPGESSKSIAVTIIDDSIVEGDEVFSVQLSNAQGASLGRPVSLVTITDNDTQSGARNPIDDARFFVRMHYLDFLGREPEPQGWDIWANILAGCPDANNGDPSSPSALCDRVNVSSAFFRSPEFYVKGYFVMRFYAASLGRPPSYAEFLRDLAGINGATTEELNAKKAAFTADWTSRDDFRARYADDTDAAAFVDHLLRTAGVTPSGPAARDALVADLRAGAKTRADVVRAVAESPELDARQYNAAFVTMQYFGYLKRGPEEKGFNDWLTYLNAHPGDFRTMVNGFVNSVEYRMRFGQP